MGKKKSGKKGKRNNKGSKKGNGKREALSKLRIGIIGLGCVGSAIYEGLHAKGIAKKRLVGYDKFKEIGSLQVVLKADILFLCLPTLYNDDTHQYDKLPIIETCGLLAQQEYKGLVVIKSTVEPQTTSKLTVTFPSLNFVHNPEFLSARTATKDFIEQSHVMLGIPASVKKKRCKMLIRLYKTFWPEAKISICTSDESETAKLFCNNFYAQKIMIFNEFQLLCSKLEIDFSVVTKLMIGNDWINPMHTIVPGTDGKPGFGGACFPKDTMALLALYKSIGSPHQVLQAAVEENLKLRQ